MIAGIGNAYLLPNLNAWLTNAVPETHRGRALSRLSMAFYIGQFLSPFWGQFIIPRYGTAAAYLITGAISAALAGIVFLIGSRFSAAPD